MKRLGFLIPLAAFVALAAILAIGLNRDPHEVPSPLIGKPAPAFSLSRVDDAGRTVTLADLRGRVWMLNVWASWCAPCRQEHPAIVALARTGLVPIYGLNYKDTRDDALGWLAQGGDPYQASLFDGDGRVGIDYGVYGVPETFIVDKTGTIRMKHVGPLTPEVIKTEIEPMLKKLNA
jgi:cytochrome c biogenesis protein CcmG/thiol:disulfide interchange protein DsbE